MNGTLGIAFGGADKAAAGAEAVAAAGSIRTRKLLALTAPRSCNDSKMPVCKPTEPVAGSRMGRWLFIALLLTHCGCGNSGLPKPGSKEYGNLVAAFYVGLAGLQTGEDVRARDKLTLATQIAPGEPAPWADLGLLQLRQQDFDPAYQNLSKARELAPDNSHIEFMLGLIESKRGKLAEAINHLKTAVKLNPNNLKAAFELAEETERENTDQTDAEAQGLFATMLKQQPANLAVRLDEVQLAAKRGDGSTLSDAIARLAAIQATLPSAGQERLKELQQAASSGDTRGAAVQVAFLRNVLARVPAYRRSLDAVKDPPSLIAQPILRFLKLPSPGSEPAPPDTSLTFTAQPVAGAPDHGVFWTGVISLDGQKPSILWEDSDGVRTAEGARLPFPGDSDPARSNAPISRFGIAAADLNYDFKTDLILAGAGGVRLYQQQDPAHFTDITGKSGLPAEITGGSYWGAWPFDVDLDGDLDVVLGPTSAEPVVLRNNGDGTFATVKAFSGVNGVTAFASADLDAGGDPDVAMLDGDGHLHVFMNERFGAFRPRSIPDSLTGRFIALAAADINGDGIPDFVLLREDGAVFRLSSREDSPDWDTAELVKADTTGQTAANATLQIADFDNNGALDILVGNQIFLGGPRGFTRLAVQTGVQEATAADVSGDGRLDLIGISGGGGVTQSINGGAKDYHWQTIRTRSHQATGDQRMNSFGIGGEIEIRAGLLSEKQIITSPILHFGLGEHTQAEVARIIWPNGFVQAEFELGTNQTILAEQRLKGSCPWLFAWDGRKMGFVKDAPPWSPALGLHINAQAVAGIYRTEEWFKIPGEDLAPHDGYYDLRITAELWETYYIDHYSLVVIDHPPGTEVYTDERFSIPPPELKVYTTGEPQPFASAHDDLGNDVSSTVRNLDGRYLDTFGRGQYQGVTRDHWVELEVPASAPASGTLFLIGQGWVHPTDATVNVALGQNSGPPPRGLSIEVPDSTGNWVTARQGLGFPAGKMKTVTLDLTGIFRPNAPRRLRLRTNLEIYWDQLGWAAGSSAEIRTTRLGLSGADLDYRGYSVVSAADRSSPEVPDYNLLGGTGQKWRDLEGYCTRYGDVAELLQSIDDRMVIMASGDELKLRFPEQPPTASGWKRDYVLIGDGWIKDGDYNSTFSKTVLPLPYHGMKDYTTPPRELEDDPAYRKHPDDWERFHTRYVTPHVFNHALRISAQQ